MIPILEKHIAAVKKVYAKNSQNRFMFSLTRPVIALAHLYRVHNRTRDYLILFEKAFMYFSNIRDVDAYLKGTPSDEPVYFSPTFMFIVRALVSGYSKLYNPMRWLKWGRLMLFLDALQGESDECTREKFTELMQELNINEKLLHDERIV
jgi:hypothetical protein